MRLTEDDIAKLKALEAMDELEKLVSGIKPSWRHPTHRVLRLFALHKLKKLRKKLIFVAELEDDSVRDGLEGLGYCTICGEPLVLAQPDCPDPQHH